MKPGLAAVLLLCVATVLPAQAASLCGFAYNFANGAQGKVRVKRFRVSADAVSGRLVCSHWKTICNGRVGAVQGRIVTDELGQSIQGTLAYGTKLSCGLYCQVEGAVGGADTMYFCQFNCPATSAAPQVSFTVARRCA